MERFLALHVYLLLPGSSPLSHHGNKFSMGTSSDTSSITAAIAPAPSPSPITSTIPASARVNEGAAKGLGLDNLRFAAPAEVTTKD